MRFKVAHAVYRAKVCEGELRLDGKRVAALTHRREIHLSGDLHPAERSETLYDQLRRLWEQHHGPMCAVAIAAFTTDFSRQVNAQGGEGVLMRLQPDGTIDAGAVEDMAGEVTGCECGTCGTRYGPHQIRTGPPHNVNGTLAVRRSVDCDFCGKTQTWVEGCTQGGLPNGRVLVAPVFELVTSGEETA